MDCTVTQTIQNNRHTVLEPWILLVCTYSFINGNWVTIYISIEQSLRLGLRYIVNVQMVNRWYRPKHQPLKVLNLFRKAGRDQKGTQDDPLLVSFLPPSSPSSMFNMLICIILIIIDCCTTLGNYSLLFVTKLQRISHFKFEFFLPSSNFLVPPFYPPKNIKVLGQIIRMILVPSLSSVNLSKELSQRGSGAGGAWAPSVRNPSSLSPHMKWHFLQGSMESRQFESRSATAPVGAPSFWKGWLRPS